MLSPLKDQVVSLGHAISHELFEKAPKHHHHGESTNHHHKAENHNVAVAHEHNFLKLVQKVIQDTKNSEQNALAKKQIKLDKHIPSRDYAIPLTTTIVANGEQNWNYKIIPYNTITAVPTAPPRV